jgi:subtilisin-like proprotein convertase family protein
MKTLHTLGCMSLLLLACGEHKPDTPNQKPDDRGAASEKAADGKSDAWNRRNNPAGLRIELNKTLADLPLEGEAENPAWPDTYWPTYRDSTNARWQSTDSFLDNLSPAEKYDAAFNQWNPFDVESLRPFDASNCDPESFDEAYYENLGPLASYVTEHKGNKATRKAALSGELDNRCDAKEDSTCVLDCGEEPEDGEDKSSFNRCVERCDRGGVETWWGSCHAWAPAAILEKEPLHPVTIPTPNGDITFEVGDIKALFSLVYDRSQAALIGGRCNDFEVKRDETTGRITNENCRDLNAGAFHVSMSNLLGLQKRGFVEDRTFDYEVWNQPVKGFEVKEMEEISVAEAHELLNVDVAMPTDCLRGFDAANDDYCYNSDVDALFKVKTTLHWLTESQASVHALGNDHVARYSRTDTYDYILEVKDGAVVGGEWYGNSVRSHPDFIWLPFGPGAMPRNLEIESVKMLNRLAQSSPEGRAEAKPPFKVKSGELQTMIPDNTPAGVDTELDVNDSSLNDVDTRVSISVSIAHSYSGDLKISVTAPNGTTTTLQDREGGSTHDVNRTFELPYSATVDGTWTLNVSDLYARDEGSITNWSIVVTPSESGDDASEIVAPLEFENRREASIPDNDLSGVKSYIDIDATGNIETLEVDVDIAHTYVGDLTITLKKGGVSQVLHNREGGSSDDLQRTFSTTAFKGMALSGRWFLEISDGAHRDEGRRLGWSLRVTQ